MNEVEQLLAEIADLVKEKLDEQRTTVKRIVANLEVDEQAYKRLMASEVVNEMMVDAQFAFPPNQNHTPDQVKEKAMSFLAKKLERDKRLYLQDKQRKKQTARYCTDCGKRLTAKEIKDSMEIIGKAVCERDLNRRMDW
jgi:hypothetical protein